MRFVPLELTGAFIIEVEAREDERGLFARTFCRREFEERGLATQLVQCSLSFSAMRGTLRGMHFQTPPAEEVKIVRCTAGAVHDVIVDLRLGSPTRFRHVAVELTAANRRSLYVPQGFAHGFQTLEDRTEVFYQMNEFYSPEHASGLRFSDPKLGIKWPLEVSTMSVKDTQWPLLGD